MMMMMIMMMLMMMMIMMMMMMIYICFNIIKMMKGNEKLCVMEYHTFMS